MLLITVKLYFIENIQRSTDDMISVLSKEIHGRVSKSSGRDGYLGTYVESKCMASSPYLFRRMTKGWGEVELKEEGGSWRSSARKSIKRQNFRLFCWNSKFYFPLDTVTLQVLRLLWTSVMQREEKKETNKNSTEIGMNLGPQLVQKRKVQPSSICNYIIF